MDTRRPLPVIGAQEPNDEANKNPAAVANYVCPLVSSHGIECAVVSHLSGHDFASAGAIFATTPPWLAGKLGTPGVPAAPLPGAPPS